MICHINAIENMHSLNLSEKINQPPTGPGWQSWSKRARLSKKIHDRQELFQPCVSKCLTRIFILA